MNDISVCQTQKPKTGRYSYDNMLSYLTHIKYKDKLQYDPHDVLTLAGPDYMDYYNSRVESWKKAQDKVGKEDPNSRIVRKVIAKMESGEIAFGELSSIPKYRKLLFEPKYMAELKKRAKCVEEVADMDWKILGQKIKSREITSLDEIIASEEWKLAYKHYQEKISILIGSYQHT